MIIWLDNQDNHKDAINENYGRELLELFSMGVGNYTEDDIKECARAFTGWTIANREYMELRSQRDSDWPYGRISWHFEFHPEDHDYGEKTFLGETGNFNGEDIVDIICKQPRHRTVHRQASVQLLRRRRAAGAGVALYRAARPERPSRPTGAGLLRQRLQHRPMLRVLFKLRFLQVSEDVCATPRSRARWNWWQGVLRLTGEFDRPRYEILVTATTRPCTWAST